MSDDDFLAHYGILRRSGRYPWGSGKDQNEINNGFLDHVAQLKKQGLSEKEIADGFGISTSDLRAARSIAKTEVRKANEAMALRLKDKGMSNVAIGERMGINESSVRALLNPSLQARSDSLMVLADTLKEQVKDKTFVDIGSGVETHLGVADTKLKTAIAVLREEGYTVHYVKVKQLGTGNYTTVKVLAPPDTPYVEVYRNRDKIKPAGFYTNDDGETFSKIVSPKSVDSSRLKVRYAEEGGTDMDGVILLRRGVDDISLGSARYAQVRIAVDGTHYLKGMAMYSDDLPDGVDMMFNTNKSNTGNKLDALKKIKDDPENPFGAVIRQKHYTDASGKSQLSPINIVNEEGRWSEWSRTLSSQMLSKQTPALVKQQLDASYDIRKAEYDEIMSLTNPAVRKKLLATYADSADSAAEHLKAAGLPRTANHVILPFPDIKPTEIYAPNYNDGERVVLIRHPHGGRFEIPELVVNNKLPSAKRTIGRAVDAVGIHPRVAEQLSGADFDGDTVLVIPNPKGQVKTSKPLKGLKDFDPKVQYPAYEGMTKMSPRGTQMEMGKISNLITDMTIARASEDEIARAVRHSMVVIDAEKHGLNYKQSEADNGIAALKAKYQGGSRSGAKTLISRASSEVRIPDVKPRSARDGGPIDPKTGEKVFVETGATRIDKAGREVPVKITTTRMAITKDARTLSSGTVVEEIYASYANSMKGLGNQARKAYLETTPIPYSKSAKAVYSSEVAALNKKLAEAIKNQPLERRAQLIANAQVKMRRDANPEMSSSERKKIEAQALETARARVGAKKNRIVLTESEWSAIQAGAISNSKLEAILDNADLDRVKELALPRDAPVMTSPAMNRARTMLRAGYTQAEIASALGVSASTLNSALSREES